MHPLVLVHFPMGKWTSVPVKGANCVPIAAGLAGIWAGGGLPGGGVSGGIAMGQDEKQSLPVRPHPYMSPKYVGSVLRQLASVHESTRINKTSVCHAPWQDICLPCTVWKSAV